MEKLLQLLVLVPYFYFYSWQRKVQPGRKHFSFLYYFYWIYLPLMALFSLAFTLFSLILFNFILLEPKDLARWLIWIVLVFLSLFNDWIVYTCLKFMNKLRLEKKKSSLPWKKWASFYLIENDGNFFMDKLARSINEEN